MYGREIHPQTTSYGHGTRHQHTRQTKHQRTTTQIVRYPVHANAHRTRHATPDLRQRLTPPPPDCKHPFVGRCTHCACRVSQTPKRKKITHWNQTAYLKSPSSSWHQSQENSTLSIAACPARSSSRKSSKVEKIHSST
ncbi:unnamed protein product [Ectocarpus sp. 6 AP-2014]